MPTKTRHFNGESPKSLQFTDGKARLKDVNFSGSGRTETRTLIF